MNLILRAILIILATGYTLPSLGADSTETAREWAMSVRRVPNQIFRMRIAINSESELLFIEVAEKSDSNELLVGRFEFGQIKSPADIKLTPLEKSKNSVDEVVKKLRKMRFPLIPPPNMYLHDDGVFIGVISLHGSENRYLGSLIDFTELEQLLVKVLPRNMLTASMQRWLHSSRSQRLTLRSSWTLPLRGTVLERRSDFSSLTLRAASAAPVSFDR